MNSKKIAKELLLIAKEIISSKEIILDDKLKRSIEKELKKHFDKIQVKTNDWGYKVCFEYKECDCDIWLGKKSKEFTISGHNRNWKIKVPCLGGDDPIKLIKDFKSNIDKLFTPDVNQINKLKNSISRYLKSWEICNIQNSNNGLIVDMAKKSYGSGYDVYCEVKNGAIVDSDMRRGIFSETEKIIQETGLKNFLIRGTAD